MSTLLLYEKTNNNYNSMGLGALVHAIQPLVTRERNGIFTLGFSYPVFSPLFHELQTGCIIKADAGSGERSKGQRFEIVSISKPLNGLITIYCEHISYLTFKTALKKGNNHVNVSAQYALEEWKKLLLPARDFTVLSDVTTKSSIDFLELGKFENARVALGGTEGSILDNFGGEYIFDNNEIRLMNRAGKDSEVVIAYGKNLTDLTQEESIENTFTSVYPYARKDGENDETLILPELYIDSEHVTKYPERLIKMVDLSSEEIETIDQLRTAAKRYITVNAIGVPSVNLALKFIDLTQTATSEEIKRLEDLELCDNVTVAFNELGINATAKIIQTVWNVSLDRYESIELGNAKSNLSKTFSDQMKEQEKISDHLSILEQAQKEATDILTNPAKGHVVVYPSLSDPQEILIMDTQDINTAKNVWRWNSGGLGFSSTGYNGSYGLAMTNNGAIVADRITTGILRAITIIGVYIEGSEIIGGRIEGATFISHAPIGSLYYTMVMKNGGINFYKQGSDIESLSSHAQIQVAPLSTEGQLWIKVGNSMFTITGDNTGTTTSNLTTGLQVGKLLEANGGLTARSRFTIPNGVALNFYSSLNMNGYSILNQSDIRLKENIEDTIVQGIKETKKLKMVDFDWRSDYNKSETEQRPDERQFGMIAQYSPFLSRQGEDNHYLMIDVNKQINLNTKTNQELITMVENLQERIETIERRLLDENI
ncbi:phage tail protein [Enterococcus sp. BWM-S5]|uniref:Phage tail protein n=1 Tax=Enterococcus larvae TaxID=2794352 RepID=A0ABS4CEL4_9ENTE|nr:phage tail spike protein [Enterococcus larvae]MBP1044840.1 phage tail protein [Enterococcus larvae]